MESPNESLYVKDVNLNTVREPQESTEALLRNIDSIEGSRGNFDGIIESPELYTYMENLDEQIFPCGNVGNFQIQDYITLSPADVPTNFLVPPPPPPPPPTPSWEDVTLSLNYRTTSVASTSTTSSSNENEESMVMVSPADVFGELATPKKKRARKPNSGTRIPPTPKPEKPKKRKVYEIDEPYADKKMERKRKCAITSKKHRDNNKLEKEQMKEKLKNVENERDSLKREVEALRMKEVELSRQLEVFKEYFGRQAASIEALLSTGHVSP